MSVSTAEAIAVSSIASDLTGVPETTLLTLWNRASFATGRRQVLDDPIALAALRRVDFDGRARFGAPYPAHAIRSRWSDEQVGAYLARRPHGPVVVLGEGLETQLWRVDNGTVDWLSVDLPETLAVRERLLPRHPRARTLALSALDTAWFDAVPESDEILVSAAGLLMYFEREQVLTLLRRMVQRWPRGTLVFDTIPHWFSRKTLQGLTRHGYTFPSMPFALALGDVAAFLAEAGLRADSVQTFAQPYPRHMRVWSWLSGIGWFRDRVAPGLVLASWGQSELQGR